ncbi:MAG: serine/threonine protein kinase [Myxococcales bacterium]|nr:serine/threonine protein kinase [Myxococcales bacterium]
MIASTYAVRSQISSTDTGAVFEARDMTLDRIVAVKIAWRDPGTPALIVEARRCAVVKDPCSVEIHALGFHNGAAYVVAERIAGWMLRDVPEPTTAIYLKRLRALVAAVAKAHDARIAVGDLSGDTVLVGPGDRIVLGRLSLSQVPAFGPHGCVFAPEIARGEVGASDPAAAEAIDLYNLGCVALEMASGEAPFASDTCAEQQLRHATEPAPLLSDLRTGLPHELSDLVEWLLAKHPALRPRSANDVLEQLDTIIERQATVSSVRVLIVVDDEPRARLLWSLARRAHPAAIIDVASEGGDAVTKLHRDPPDLVFVDAALRGTMNALELCMYARGIEGAARNQICLVGRITDGDRALFTQVSVPFIPDDGHLPIAILDYVRSAARQPRMT